MTTTIYTWLEDEVILTTTPIKSGGVEHKYCRKPDIELYEDSDVKIVVFMPPEKTPAERRELFKQGKWSKHGLLKQHRGSNHIRDELSPYAKLVFTVDKRLYKSTCTIMREHDKPTIPKPAKPPTISYDEMV